MGRDYYQTLGVSRNVNFDELRAGYARCSMKWHPQKNTMARAEAEQRFRDIAEAFDVLSDPLRRQRYDELGERGLKFPPPGSAFEPYQYVGDPFALFLSFFSDSNPLKAACDVSLDGCAPGILAKEFEKAIEIEVPCSLAEMQEGTTRRLTAERIRLDPKGCPYKESKLITLPVRAGWKPGTRVTFRGEGNHSHPSKQPGNLVAIITEMPFPADEPSEE
mmetsp:Transcript_8220/g.17965  ORF Transcript_8220/g.17965 Transcript_8220/m.17965 type:complete len:219 (-) Transcript_8220:68-724(-)